MYRLLSPKKSYLALPLEESKRGVDVLLCPLGAMYNEQITLIRMDKTHSFIINLKKKIYFSSM